MDSNRQAIRAFNCCDNAKKIIQVETDEKKERFELHVSRQVHTPKLG